MDIRWQSYVWEETRPVARSALERLEFAWGVELPGDYKKVVADHQGKTPEPCVFKVGKGANVFSVLLTVDRDADRASYSIQDSYDLIRPKDRVMRRCKSKCQCWRWVKGSSRGVHDSADAILPN